MLFALTEDGVPSVATFVEITMDEIFGRREGGTPAAFVVVSGLILRLKFPVIEWGR